MIGSTLKRVLGGGGTADDRVRSGPLVGPLLFLVPLAAALRFGGYGTGEEISFAVLALPWITTAMLAVQWSTSCYLSLNRTAFMKRRAGWMIWCVVGPVLGVGLALEGGEPAAWGGICVWLLFTAIHRVFELVMESPFLGRRPALTFTSTFVILAFGGAVLLETAPRATAAGEISFVDALFTSMSATCVTGLEVLPTGTTFTHFGQVVILALIQLGGLGLMTLGTFLLLTTGRRLGVSDRALVRDVLNVEGAGGVIRLVVAILVVTLGCELLGAIALRPYYASADDPTFSALFHSISAFCNAGFALSGDSFQKQSGMIGFNLVVIALITVGGFGFTVFRELAERVVARLRRRVPVRLSLHTRIVVMTSVLLVTAGAVGIWLLEHDRALAGRPPLEQVLVAVFQSVSARTAGFSSVAFSSDEGSLGVASRFFLLPFMLVGASPGSTGGGLKTTTITVLVFAVAALFRNRRSVVAEGRTIPDDTIKRAAAIVTLYLALVFGSVFALLVSEGSRFALGDLLFEAISAVATVGFSSGVSSSPHLSDFGKVVLIVLMFAGRLGPLTLVLITASSKKQPSSVSYPDERVMIG